MLYILCVFLCNIVVIVDNYNNLHFLQTDYEGQAKKLMELLEHTDMLIVAGGDGTMQEVITGLLRRPDQVGTGVITDWLTAEHRVDNFTLAFH